MLFFGRIKKSISFHENIKQHNCFHNAVIKQQLWYTVYEQNMFPCIMTLLLLQTVIYRTTVQYI